MVSTTQLLDFLRENESKVNYAQPKEQSTSSQTNQNLYQAHVSELEAMRHQLSQAQNVFQSAKTSAANAGFTLEDRPVSPQSSVTGANAKREFEYSISRLEAATKSLFGQITIHHKQNTHRNNRKIWTLRFIALLVFGILIYPMVQSIAANAVRYRTDGHDQTLARVLAFNPLENFRPGPIAPVDDIIGYVTVLWVSDYLDRRSLMFFSLDLYVGIATLIPFATGILFFLASMTLRSNPRRSQLLLRVALGLVLAAMIGFVFVRASEPSIQVTFTFPVVTMLLYGFGLVICAITMFSFRVRT
jgi:hypothetical protein